MGQQPAAQRSEGVLAAPVGRRRMLAALGGAGVAGIAGTALLPTPAGAGPTPWNPLNLQLKSVLMATPYPVVAGATTTAESFVDGGTGLVYLRFYCFFASVPVTNEPVTNPPTADHGKYDFWGFDLGWPGPSSAFNRRRQPLQRSCRVGERLPRGPRGIRARRARAAHRRVHGGRTADHLQPWLHRLERDGLLREPHEPIQLERRINHQGHGHLLVRLSTPPVSPDKTSNMS